MSGRKYSLAAAVAAAVCMSPPLVVLARGGGGGGGGGGHGGGGGGHGGGGHSGGGYSSGFSGGHSSAGHSWGGGHTGGHSPFGGSGHSGSVASHGGSIGVVGGTHFTSGGGFGTSPHGPSFLGNHAGVAGKVAVDHDPGWRAHHRHGYPHFGYGFGSGGWWLSSNWYWPGAYGYGGYYDDCPDCYTPAGQATGDASAYPQSTLIASLSLAEFDRRFAEAGEDAFRAGDYHGAVYYWRHALLDDSQNPVLVMMLGQALFATGQFDEAAGATQAAMHILPKEHWGVVVVNFRELYGDARDYTTQLRALEKAVAEKPDNPARHFLAGFHYAYLGYPQFAVNELEKGLQAEPHDEMAKQLRDEMQAKLPKPTPPAPTTPPSSYSPAAETSRCPVRIRDDVT